MTANPRITIISRTETGSRLAGRLMGLGASLIEVDPASKSPAGSFEEAVPSADVVLVTGSSPGPKQTAERVVPLLGKEAIYADLNTGTPARKRQLAALFPEGSFVDAAIVQQDPSPAEGLVLDVAGTGARRLIALLEPVGLTLRYVSEVPGEATGRNLIRSLLAEGIAGALIDCLWAAESMGLQSWAHQEILDKFEVSSAETAQQYLSGTAQHVKRRQIEIMDVVAMLNETGYESTMLPGIEFNYGRILHGKKIPHTKRP